MVSPDAGQADLRHILQDEGYQILKEAFAANACIPMYHVLKDNNHFIAKLVVADDEVNLLHLRSEWNLLDIMNDSHVQGIPKSTSWQVFTKAFGIIYTMRETEFTLKELYCTEAAFASLHSDDDWIMLLSRIKLLCLTLSECNALDIRHGNLRPDLLYCDTSKSIEDRDAVTLFCWLYASRLAIESSFPSSAILNTSLSYVAPECTGRMNRAVDLRADLYSLGVLLYELACQRLPFEGRSTLELMHKHISQDVVPPSSIRNLPQPIELLIMKLLRKNPDDRYQSALGVAHDLDHIISYLRQPPALRSEIDIGGHDRASRFIVSSEFVGREKEIQSLMGLFRDLQKDSVSRVAVIGGYSGIGKSRLVKEVLYQISQAKVFYTECKFDQYKTFAPFATMNTLVCDLLAQIFIEPPEVLELWRQKIASALGNQALAVCELCPDLITLLTPRYISSLPELVPLGAMASEERMKQALKTLIQTFASKEHPLIIFIDDIQWSPLIDLQIILGIREQTDLFIICAYRDNEIGPEHFVSTVFLDHIQPDVQLTIKALDPADATSLIASTLHRPRPSKSSRNSQDKDLQDLVDLIYLKSQGNCFFIMQILLTLHRSDLLQFDFAKGFWTWELDSIRSVEMSHDVIELVLRQVTDLPADCQEVLKVASCLGNTSFRLDILDITLPISKADLAKIIFPAMSAGLVIPVSESYKASLALESNNAWAESSNAQKDISSEGGREEFPSGVSNDRLIGDDLVVSYRFLHDRVQQAVYALIDEKDRPALHLRIGMRLLAVHEENLADAMLFDICSQVNRGWELTDRKDHLHLAHLNVKAARVAYRNTANDAALDLLKQAGKFLPEDIWSCDSELAEAYFGLMEEVNASLTFYDEALRASETILQKTTSVVTRTRMYDRQMKVLMSKGCVIEALNMAAKGLTEVDIDFQRFLDGSAGSDEAQKRITELWNAVPLDAESIHKIKESSVMTDKRMLAAADLLVTMLPTVFFVKPELIQLLVLTGIRISLDRGLGGYSCYFMCFLALIVCEIESPRTDFALAEAYTTVAEQILGDLMKVDQSVVGRAGATLTLAGCVYAWTRDARVDSRRVYGWAIDQCLRCFDGEYTAFALGDAASQRLFAGENLHNISLDLQKYIKAVKSYKRDIGEYYCFPTLQAIENLAQRTTYDNINDLCGEILMDEALAIRSMKEGSMLLHEVFYWATKLLLSVLYADHSGALAAVLEGHKLLQGAFGVPIKKDFETFAIVAMIDARDRHELPPELESCLALYCSHIEQWAQHSSKNFGSWHFFQRAELNKNVKDLPTVLQDFNSAIDLVTESENFLLAGFYNERCARFITQSGLGKRMAVGLASESAKAYRDWGCPSKSTEIIKEFGLSVGDSIEITSGTPDLEQSKSSIHDPLLQLSQSKIPGDSSRLVGKPATDQNDSRHHRASHEAPVPPRLLSSPVPITRGPGKVPDSDRNGEGLDLETVVQNSLLLARGLHTSEIVPQLLTHLLQVAGAQHGALVLDLHHDQDFMLAATAGVSSVELHENISLSMADDAVPIELIRLAANAKRCIIDETKYFRCRNPNRTASAENDLVISQVPKSFMVLPVILADSVLAVAYLSTYQITNLFTQQKVELLTILAAQAAVALEKGKIYTELKIANDELYQNKKNLEAHSGQLAAIVTERTRQLQQQNDVLSREIQQRKQMEVELVQAKDTAEQATAMKSRFLAMMSHEMRTPFNAVIGFATLLLDTQLSVEQRDMAQSIVESSTDLIAIINDILDFSKIENDKMNLDPIWFDMRAMVESTMEVVARNAALKDLQLAYLEDPEIAADCIYADNTRLRQCLLNLLSNAVKFTPSDGTVRISTRLEILDKESIEDLREALLTVDVIDTGIGIAKEDQTKLFRFFSQVDDSTTRRFGGTGLGLAISHKICTLFGGDLSVVSKVNEGSTFTATFKVHIDRKHHPSDVMISNTFKDKVCLVLEPSQYIQLNIKQHLTAFGIRSIIKSNLDEIAAATDLVDFAIIGDSFNQPETILSLRSRGVSVNRLPLIVLMPFGATLPAQPSSTDLEAIDAVVSTPVRRIRLFRSILSLFPEESGVDKHAKPTEQNLRTIVTPTEAFPRRDISLLLVEDNIVNVKVATQLLKRLKYQPQVVHDGIEALAACANEHFDLILMDLSMPRMGGIEATRELRATQSSATGPYICAMTANAMSGDKERCMEAGMDDYITKPVMLPKLKAVIDKVRDKKLGTIEGYRDIEKIDHTDQIKIEDLRNDQAERTQKLQDMLEPLDT